MPAKHTDAGRSLRPRAARIRWIAWDLGGVLTTWNADAFARLLAKRFGVPFAAARAAWWVGRDELDRGTLTWQAYWRSCRHMLGATENASWLLQEEVAFQAPRKPALALLRSLKPRYRMVLITNICPAIMPAIGRKVRFRPHMDMVIESWRIRACKPRPAFWRALCQRTHAKPSGILVIDDMLRNVRGARAFGLRAIHFRSVAQLRRELRRLGVR